MMIVGIDMGLDGAIVRLYAGTECLSFEVDRTPTLEGLVGGKHRRSYDAQKIIEVMDLANLDAPVHAFIERVWSSPQMGVASSFSMGMGQGLYLGILAALRIPFTQVLPNTWKKAMLSGMPKGKNSSIIRAKELYPAAADRIGRHHGIADALLIAHYGLHYCLQPTQEVKS